ncbi:Protein SEEDLING PLASTID DEVELOPMENT 1 [Linum perenne]
MICNISSSIHLKPSPVIQFNPRQASSPFTIKFPHHHTSLRLPSHHCRNLAKYCTQSTHSATDVSSSTEEVFDAELDRLLSLLPEQMRARVLEHPELSGLVEVVLDLGRPPLARFPSGDFVLSDSAITLQDLQFAASQVGDFAVDNRAGISRTLHRISAIRNRKGEIIGLTCRVGRAIHGSASLLRDLVQDGASILLIGPPGVGKTTIIREIARMLANDYQKRVMIVDTSNEIGGDGDIPHSGIGNARRMQVGNSEMQHKVLIEAVENHMPQVIVIDEIGTKLEAMAASTIAQRGIQLVATAHGVTIENLIMNPSLDMLIGGIQSVTLGDDEASRRGVQKTVLERKGPSTFGCGVEIISKTELRVHRYLESTVDAVLAGRSPVVDVRKMRLQVSNGATEVEPYADTSVRNEQDTSLGGQGLMDERLNVSEFTIESPLSTSDLSLEVQPFHLYVYGTSSLVQVTKAIKALINDRDADGSKDFISDNDGKSSEKMDALEETRIAIEEVVIPKGEPVELLPRQSHIIPLQMNFIQGYKLQSEIIGTGPEARLRILPYTTQNDNAKSNHGFTDADNANGETNGSIYTVDKLPFLPDSS